MFGGMTPFLGGAALLHLASAKVKPLSTPWSFSASPRPRKTTPSSLLPLSKGAGVWAGCEICFSRPPPSPRPPALLPPALQNGVCFCYRVVCEDGANLTSQRLGGPPLPQAPKPARCPSGREESWALAAGALWHSPGTLPCQRVLILAHSGVSPNPMCRRGQRVTFWHRLCCEPQGFLNWGWCTHRL